MKKTFSIITIIALLFSLIGCNSDNAPMTGSITVSIKDSVSRTITSEVSPVAVKYAVEGTAPDGTKVSFDLSESAPSWIKAEAAPGDWSFTATAYNKDDTAIGSGTASATVVPGQSTSVTIEVYEYSGEGTLTVNLTGITSDVVTYTATVYKVLFGSLYSVASEVLTDGSITFTLPNGFYSLVLTCDNSSMVMPAAEAVRVMKGDNLSASYSICDQGSVNVVISNGIKPYPEMSVTLDKTSVAVGEEVTATVTITPGTYDFIWYVNDAELESVKENSVTITFDDEGYYKITCIAYDTETGVVWSEEAKVTVTAIQDSNINKVSFYSGNRLIESRTYTPDREEPFPSLDLGDGFSLTGWKAEGSDVLITDASFSLPYSEDVYKFYAYIDTDLLRIDETGAVYGTDVLENSDRIILTVPDSIRTITVRAIGDQAFYNYLYLTSINIPDSVTSIGEEAFNSCSSLTGITIPASVTFIGDFAFGGCSSLTSITIPDSVTSIGENPFLGCSKLTSITVSEGNNNFKSIDGVLFDKTISTIICYPTGKTEKQYTIPDSVTSIGYEAFYDCSSLTSITIPGSVISIGYGAFHYCSSLTSITIGNGVTSIGSSAFSGCSSLTGINIPDSVTSIEAMTFNGCYSLTSINIPDSVTSIGKYAFENCSGLTSINIPDSVTSIGTSAFYNCSSLTSINIPDSVTSIGEGTFEVCRRLQSITIGNNVTSIGERAFRLCSSLTSINIPDSVTFIRKNAFEKCSSLTSITIPDSVTSIGSYAFWDCTSLTSITIPDSVTSIGDSAFWSCSSLTSITIPGSVISIGYGAFSYCSSLTSINIKQKQETTNLIGAPWGAPKATVTWNYTDL